MMPRDEVHVWTLTLDRVAADVLSMDEHVRAGRFRFDADRHRFVACRAAVRTILGAYLGVPAGEVAFAAPAPGGKPCLESSRHGRTLRFNVSHSKDTALLALARDREVGVDIQWWRSLADMEAIVRRYFAPHEREAWATLPPEERPRAFFRVWTVKEAYLKACGDGLRRRLEDIEVSVGNAEPARLRRALDRVGDEANWTVTELAAAEGYSAGLVCAGVGTRPHQRNLPTSRLGQLLSVFVAEPVAGSIPDVP
jgi:4'-phosphopantetheinyl transferase